ncbi:MAG: hypothetical protein J0I06_09570 [Planctomycetes bacterium]|nr:hypothetical protein [Planctomycetota bacterium]
MPAVRLALVVVAVALPWEAAPAQPPPWAGGPVPPGQLYGYSPLVHTIEPFPSKTSGYGLTMFHARGDKRANPPLVIDPRRPCPTVVIEVRDAPRAPALLPAGAFEPVGPVVRPRPARGAHRFAAVAAVNPK